MLSALFLEHAVVFIYLYNRDRAGGVAATTCTTRAYWDFVLHCVLAFSAMAMWSESQIDRIRDLGAELDHLRRERRQGSELDHLTGLLNQAALAQRIEQPGEFGGVVAVCDMDNFKDINDRYGHLVGDEILRNVGSLLQASIRHEDEAFRWGGDEFVILFHNQQLGGGAAPHGGPGSPPARFPHARLRRAAAQLQLGSRGRQGPAAARRSGRSRPQHVRPEAGTRRPEPPAV